MGGGRLRWYLAGWPAALLLLISITTCGGGQAPAAAGACDLECALQTGQSRVDSVTVTAIVISEPQISGNHERALLKDPAGQVFEMDQNTTLAPPVPVRPGDRLTLHGQFYNDGGGRIGIHCLHARTSRGCPVPGWIEYQGRRYQ